MEVRVFSTAPNTFRLAESGTPSSSAMNWPRVRRVRESFRSSGYPLIGEQFDHLVPLFHWFLGATAPVSAHPAPWIRTKSSARARVKRWRAVDRADLRASLRRGIGDGAGRVGKVGLAEGETRGQSPPKVMAAVSSKGEVQPKTRMLRAWQIAFGAASSISWHARGAPPAPLPSARSPADCRPRGPLRDSAARTSERGPWPVFTGGFPVWTGPTAVPRPIPVMKAGTGLRSAGGPGGGGRSFGWALAGRFTSRHGGMWWPGGLGLFSPEMPVPRASPP